MYCLRFKSADRSLIGYIGARVSADKTFRTTERLQLSLSVENLEIETLVKYSSRQMIQSS